MTWNGVPISIDPSNLLAVCIAIVALVVSIWQAISNRPKLRVVVNFGPIWDGQSADSSGDLFLMVSTFNRGVQPTTITAINFATFRNLLERVRFRYSYLAFGKVGPNSTPIPFHLVTGAEHRFYFLINDKTVSDFLEQSHFVVDVHHSWSDRPHRKVLSQRVKRAAIAAWKEGAR